MFIPLKGGGRLEAGVGKVQLPPPPQGRFLDKICVPIEKVDQRAKGQQAIDLLG